MNKPIMQNFERNLKNTKNVCKRNTSFSFQWILEHKKNLVKIVKLMPYCVIHTVDDRCKTNSLTHLFCAIINPFLDAKKIIVCMKDIVMW